jgi:DNA-binding transcriptional LysR family regulator
MELRQFKYFIEIVDHKSLSRAAAHLHVAQSALSRQMAELEAELGVRLLQRSRSGVTMTEAGKVFHEYARGILQQIRDAREAVLRSSDTVVGSVIVALPQSVAATLALPLMRAAAARYPNVLFHLNEELTGNMIDQLLGGRVDIALFTDTMPARDIAFVPLVEEAFVLMHAPHDPSAPAPGEVSLDQATARPLVLPSPQHGHCTRWVVAAAGGGGDQFGLRAQERRRGRHRRQHHAAGPGPARGRGATPGGASHPGAGHGARARAVHLAPPARDQCPWRDLQADRRRRAPAVRGRSLGGGGIRRSAGRGRRGLTVRRERRGHRIDDRSKGHRPTARHLYAHTVESLRSIP